MSGEARKDKAAKVATARNLWVPAINNHGGFGRWAFLEITDPWDAKNTIRAFLRNSEVNLRGQILTNKNFDEINYWSEIKLDIIRDYASAYSRILAAQNALPFCHIYIDAFAGAGLHVSKTQASTWQEARSTHSRVEPPFRHYYFIDLDSGKSDALRELTSQYPNVSVYEGDCNESCLKKCFRTQGSRITKGLCACLTHMACT